MNSAPMACAVLIAGTTARRSAAGYTLRQHPQPATGPDCDMDDDDEIDSAFERRKQIPPPELGRAGHQHHKQEALEPTRRRANASRRSGAS